MANALLCLRRLCSRRRGLRLRPARSPIPIGRFSVRFRRRCCAGQAPQNLALRTAPKRVRFVAPECAVRLQRRRRRPSFSFPAQTAWASRAPLSEQALGQTWQIAANHAAHEVCRTVFMPRRAPLGKNRRRLRQLLPGRRCGPKFATLGGAGRRRLPGLARCGDAKCKWRLRFVQATRSRAPPRKGICPAVSAAHPVKGAGRRGAQ